MITWYPACVVIHERYLRPCSVTRTLRRLLCFCSARPPAKEPPPNTRAPERRATRFLRDRCAPFIDRRRWLLLAASLLLTGGAATALYLLYEPADELVFLNADHPWQMWMSLQSNEFLVAEDWKHAVSIMCAHAL